MRSASMTPLSRRLDATSSAHGIHLLVLPEKYGVGMSAHAATHLPRSRAWWVSRLWDAVIVIALLALTVAVQVADPAPVNPMSVGMSALGILALLWRRVFPIVVLGVTATVGIFSAALGDGSVVALPLAIAIASVVASGKRRVGAAAAVGLAVVLVPILVARGDAWNGSVVIATVLMLALGLTVGLVQDARRRIVQDAIDRAGRAEDLRDAEARRAVAEERLRISRELHDVLAHQIAVIGVQTGVAEYVLEDDPAAARQALVTARTASTSALAELATLLQLLRRSDDDPRTAPAPSLAHLPALLDDMRQTGLQIDAHVDDPLPALPPVIDLAAYRVLQEGLTNAHKHGDGRAEVTVVARPGALDLSIHNDVGSGAMSVPSSGWGLVGMRERVEGVGGTLSMSASPRAFVLDVVLPTGRVSVAAAEATS